MFSEVADGYDSFGHYTTAMRSGTWDDHLTSFASARVLMRPIYAIKDASVESDATLVVNPPGFVTDWGPLVYIAPYGERHYESTISVGAVVDID
eukprot:2097119-Lingulodinium_polyedra.AAC.1